MEYYDVFVCEDNILNYECDRVKYERLSKDAMKCLSAISLDSGMDVLIREYCDDDEPSEAEPQA